MHMRRHRLTQSIAMQTSATSPSSGYDIVELNIFPLREPVSGRTYSVVRLRTEAVSRDTASVPEFPMRTLKRRAKRL